MSWGHLVSLGVWVMFLVSWYLGARHRRIAHLAFVIAAMAVDISLTLYLEMTRGAIEQAVGQVAFIGNRTLLLYVHVPLALLVLLVCYPGSVILGIVAWRTRGAGYQSRRNLHVWWGKVTVICYTLSFLTAPRFVVDRIVAALT